VPIKYTVLILGSARLEKQTCGYDYWWPVPAKAQARRTENPQITSFFYKILLLAHPTQLAESFPMGPCSTSGDKNSLRYDLGPRHCDCHVSTQ
jgi:hypothetical protein